MPSLRVSSSNFATTSGVLPSEKSRSTFSTPKDACKHGPIRSSAGLPRKSVRSWCAKNTVPVPLSSPHGKPSKPARPNAKAAAATILCLPSSTKSTVGPSAIAKDGRRIAPESLKDDVLRDSASAAFTCCSLHCRAARSGRAHSTRASPPEAPHVMYCCSRNARSLAGTARA